VSIADGQSRLGIDAGFVATAATGSGVIGDYVWSDQNGDGIQNRGEPGVANAQVQLLNCSNQTLATTTTDTKGAYRFQQLAAGKYKIRFVLSSGYEFSPRKVASTSGGYDSNPDPSTGLTTCVSIADGQSRLGIDAGFVATDVDSAARITAWKGATGGVSGSGNTIN
jgi:hypothetical protein